MPQVPSGSRGAAACAAHRLSEVWFGWTGGRYELA